MLLFTKVADLKTFLRKEQRSGKTIGFVPTMGYLHEGHQSLIRKSADENDITVVSIFVNPTQFGPGEDFERYPRDIERDKQLTGSAGAKILFVPEISEMYPDGYCTYVEVEKITDNLCGASRPGHFKGVTTIVAKLLNITYPDRAYFGQKDAQQAIIIQRMVRNLDMDTQIVVCPIIREKDGLAMSSRNVYLSADERTQALVLSQSLNIARELIKSGERDALKIRGSIEKMIQEKSLAKIDYIAAVDAQSLESVDLISSKVLIALAVKFGKTRLIDNIIVEV